MTASQFSAADADAQKCSQCGKANAALKRCTGCMTVAYCDRNCQTAAWKMHKKVCATFANIRNAIGAERSDSKPFTAIFNNNFLHDRPEEETFKILIDAIRMRQEDVHTHEADRMLGTIYDQEPSSEKALRNFLRLAKDVNGFLPPWWNDKKTEACVRFGLDRDEGYLLKCIQEESDIQQRWNDHKMPTKLRILGERVYGNAPGGAKGEKILTMMMQTESGGFGIQVDCGIFPGKGIHVLLLMSASTPNAGHSPTLCVELWQEREGVTQTRSKDLSLSLQPE